MSHAIPVPDETYQTIAELAREQGTTPEALTERLLRERLAECEAISRQDEEWAAGLDDALARAARGENAQYASKDEFFAALDNSAAKDGGA